MPFRITKARSRSQFWSLLLATIFLIGSRDPQAQQPAARPDPILSENVKVSGFKELRYPLYAQASHIEGTVVIRAEIGASGQVVSATPLAGPKALLKDCAENLKEWSFYSPRSSDVIVVYWFRFSGLCNGLCPSSFQFYPPTLAVITVGNTVVAY